MNLLPTYLLLTSAASAYIVYAVIKFLHKVIWQPLQTQRFLNSQGLKGPPYTFLLGNAKQLIQLREEALAKSMPSLSHDIAHRVIPHISLWSKQYGKNFVFWIGPRAQMVLGEPDLIKEVLSNKARIFSKSELYSPYLRKIFGQGLAISEGEKWVKMRKMADFALHGDNLKSMVPDMIASAEMMLERWKMKEGKEIEVHEEFRILSSEVISRTAFGSSFKEGQHIFGMLNELMILSDRNTFKMSLPIISDLFKTKDEKGAIRLVQRIADSIMEMVKNRQEKVKNREVDGFGKDYLGLLLKAYHDEGHSMKISADQLVDECKTLYVAGQETTNTLLSWMILLLSIHQEWQEEARREVLRVFGPDKTPDSDGITRLKLMGMIINETLRLYSPVFAGFMRDVDKETKLGKFDLPVGVQFHIPIMAIHHDPDIWGEDVHLFKPERFSEGVAKATNNNPSAFMPFGMGPHTCAGFNFATNEAKITIAMILQRFTFSLSPGYVHSPFPVLAVRPEKGVQVIINAL